MKYFKITIQNGYASRYIDTKYICMSDIEDDLPIINSIMDLMNGNEVLVIEELLYVDDTMIDYYF